MSHMRILLLQFRPDPVMADHEFSLILARSGRTAEEFVRLDTTREPLAIERLDGMDALVLGGSGDYLISQDDIPSIRAALRPFLAEARARNIPTLGICFGGQLMTEAFGGVIALDESRAETGTFLVTKIAHGERDPLFSYLPKTFDAQLGHKDHFISIPAAAVHLASSERSPNQA